jgi:hypothetical protein
MEPVTPVETTTFVKVTSADQLVAGKKYIIVAGNKAMGVEATGNFLTAIDITAGDEVEVGDNVAIMTLAGTLGHYTLALGDQYLHAANSTSLNFGTATEWAIADYNGTLDGYRVKHADYNRAVRYSAGYNRFGNYSTTDENSVYGWIYVEKTETPALQDLTGHIVFSEVNQEDGSFTVSYDGPEEDVAVEVISIVEKTRDGNKLPDYGTYTVTAKASKTGYNDLEESADLTWNAPTPQTAQPTVTYEETEDGYLVTVTGDGVLTLVVDDEEVVLNENNQYLIPYTNTPEGEEHTVVATAQVPGQRVSEPMVIEVQDPGQTDRTSVA